MHIEQRFIFKIGSKEIKAVELGDKVGYEKFS